MRVNDRFSENYIDDGGMGFSTKGWSLSKVTKSVSDIFSKAFGVKPKPVVGAGVVPPEDASGIGGLPTPLLIGGAVLLVLALTMKKGRR